LWIPIRVPQYEHLNLHLTTRILMREIR